MVPSADPTVPEGLANTADKASCSSELPACSIEAAYERDSLCRSELGINPGALKPDSKYSSRHTAKKEVQRSLLKVSVLPALA